MHSLNFTLDINICIKVQEEKAPVTISFAATVYTSS